MALIVDSFQELWWKLPTQSQLSKSITDKSTWLQNCAWPTHANSTDVKELPRRQNYFWIAKGHTKADASHWIADAKKEWAQWCDTMWICYIWKQWLWVKIGSKKYQEPLVQTEICLFTPRIQISGKPFMWLKWIVWRRNLALVLLAIIYFIKKEP